MELFLITSLMHSSLVVSRNTAEFCILTLHSATLLNSYSSNRFYTFLRTSYIQDHIIYEQTQFYFFVSSLNIFHFFLLRDCSGTSRALLSRSGESGHSCLFLVLGRKQSFTIEYNVTCEFLVDAFYLLEEVPTYS